VGGKGGFTVQLDVISHCPKGKAKPNPVVFVHGAWHGAWCWENFQPYFAERGYESHALSLRGHGNSEGRDNIRWDSPARDYVADVAQVVQGLMAPPVLVGHSLGGYVVERYLEIHAAPAGVLLAPIPVSGIYQFAVRLLFRCPWQFVKTHLFLDPWYVMSTPELAQASFFSPDMPSETVHRHFKRLGHESFRMELELFSLLLRRPKPIATPLLLLAGEKDRAFSVAEQKATARAYNIQAEVFPNMAHDMMLESGWQAVANRIMEWLQQRQL
jgi:pimeloyl-ACP methyl ester carboxylesterase